jgi:hypothetical protein
VSVRIRAKAGLKDILFRKKEGDDANTEFVSRSVSQAKMV